MILAGIGLKLGVRSQASLFSRDREINHTNTVFFLIRPGFRGTRILHSVHAIGAPRAVQGIETAAQTGAELLACFYANASGGSKPFRQGGVLYRDSDLQTAPTYVDWIVLLNMRLIGAGPTATRLQPSLLEAA